MPAAAVPAVEPHDVVFLVFHPDAAQEPAFAGLLHRGDVKHEATHFTQEFAPHVIKLVVLFIEAVRVQENHLQEPAGHELRRKREEVADSAKDLPALAIGVRQGNQGDALRKVRAAKKIFVARGHGPEFFVRPLVLDVCLDERRVLPDLLDGPVLVGDDPVNHIRHGSRLLCWRGRRCGARRQATKHYPQNDCSFSTHLLSPQ